MDLVASHFSVLAVLVTIGLFIVKIKKKVEENNRFLEQFEGKHNSKTLK